MSGHTAGPWRVGDAGHTIFGPKEADGKLPQRIGEVCAVRESYLANARLIAAAPELLAALKECEEALGGNLVWLGDALDLRIRQKDTETIDHLGALNDAWICLCKAIAKAEGDQS